MTPYFDVHTHINFSAYEADVSNVIERALADNVWMIAVGTQKDTSRRAVEIANQYEKGIYAAVGLHPIHTEQSHHDVKELGGSDAAQAFTSRGEDFDFEYYKRLALDPRTVAIGECGLDYYRLNVETKDKQSRALTRQIELACEVKKPLMIHCRSGVSERASQDAGREAFEDLIDLLEMNQKKLNDPPGMVHFFTGTKNDAERLLSLGFAFAFGGVITFARNYDEILEYLPLDAILSETDAPYVTPVPYRGKRNEPSYVIEVVKKLAEIKGFALDKMKDQIFLNARRILKFD